MERQFRISHGGIYKTVIWAAEHERHGRLDVFYAYHPDTNERYVVWLELDATIEPC